MLEKDVERYLAAEVKKRLGGKALKFVSPGHNGVPDRIVLYPSGHVAFVELKAPGKKRRALQIQWAERLQRWGFLYACLDTYESVDTFIAFLLERGVSKK